MLVFLFAIMIFSRARCARAMVLFELRLLALRGLPPGNRSIKPAAFCARSRSSQRRRPATIAAIVLGCAGIPRGRPPADPCNLQRRRYGSAGRRHLVPVLVRAPQSLITQCREQKAPAQGRAVDPRAASSPASREPLDAVRVAFVAAGIVASQDECFIAGSNWGIIPASGEAQMW